MTARPDLTALLSAYGRAFHTVTETEPIFRDEAARSLFSNEEWNEIHTYLENGKAFFGKDMRSAEDVLREHIIPTPVCHAAFCEDALLTSLRSGTRQYVNLGAGLDTFAFRHPELDGKCRIFEADLPEVQENKRARISRAGWYIPRNLHLIPADLTKDSLTKLLPQAGFDVSCKTFFSWTGVSYYLDRTAIEKTLASVSAAAPDGSSLAFDYADNGLFQAAETRVQKLLQFAAGSGSPMKSCFSYEEMERLLSRYGFLIYEHMHPEDIQRRLIGTHSGMKAFEHIRFILAVKKD